MSRPEHLNCVNTAEGIMRINENQAHYDSDPEGYEQCEREYREQCEREAYEMAIERGEMSEEQARHDSDLPF
jgi:hypothetical protein